MKAVKIGTHTVELYDAIDELPIARFHQHQKYLLLKPDNGFSLPYRFVQPNLRNDG